MYNRLGSRHNVVIEKFKCKLTDASTIQERLFSASKAARKKRKQAAEDNACFVAKVTAVVESEGETAREDGMQDVDVADTTAAVVEGGGDVGDDGPNTDSSNVRECLRRERATMLMCSCLCLSCIFVSKCPKIEPLSLSVQLILHLLCRSSSSNPPSPDSSSSPPSFAGSTDSCTACQVSDKCLTDN